MRAGNGKLGVKARKAIERAHLQNQVLVSAISFWEVAMLDAANRVNIKMGVSRWRQRILEDGVREVAMDGEIGIRASELLSSHPDPADRMIVATAQQASARLCTADGALLRMKLPVSTIDATR